MWRAAIASVLLVAGCAGDPVEYEVTTSLQTGSTARIVGDDGRLFVNHTETYVVSDYDELRNVAQTALVRANEIDVGVVLPFAASACGSDEWMHSGELMRIEVRYIIYPTNNNAFMAYTDSLTCLDDAGEGRTVIQ